MSNNTWRYKSVENLTEEERELRREWIIKERKRRKILLCAAVAFLLLIIAVPIVIFTVFRLETVSVTVEGKMPHTDEEIVAASGAELGKNVLLFDLEKSGKSIVDSLPYASEATVARSLPTGLDITVKAAKESYALFLNDKNLYLLLDENFRILAETGSIGSGIIPITAPEPVSATPGEMLAFAKKSAEGGNKKEVYDDTLRAIKALTAAIKAEKLDKITEINVTSITDIKAVYDGRIMLRFGTASDLDAKVNLAASAIGQENERNPEQIGTLNLSITKKAFFKQNFFDGEKVEPVEETDEDTVDAENEDGSDYENEDAGYGEEYAGDDGYEQDNGDGYSEDYGNESDEEAEDYREYYADDE